MEEMINVCVTVEKNTNIVAENKFWEPENHNGFQAFFDTIFCIIVPKIYIRYLFSTFLTYYFLKYIYIEIKTQAIPLT